MKIERRYIWPEPAIERMRANGVDPLLALQAVAAPEGLYAERRTGDLLDIAGMTEAGVVVRVLAALVAGNQLARVITAAYLQPSELADWSRRAQGN